MKNFLLLPIFLISLLISESSLAGRKPKSGKSPSEYQIEHITTCNSSGEDWSDSCNKIWRINRDKITNENFISSKKMESRYYLNKCIVEEDLFHCVQLSKNYPGQSEKLKIEWLKDDITEKQYSTIERLAEKWQEKIDARVERNSPENNRKKIEILVTCKRLIKANLKDPNSFKMINNLETQVRTGIVEYTATNSFGGRVREAITCFNPKDF